MYGGIVLVLVCGFLADRVHDSSGYKTMLDGLDESSPSFPWVPGTHRVNNVLDVPIAVGIASADAITRCPVEREAGAASSFRMLHGVGSMPKSVICDLLVHFHHQFPRMSGHSLVSLAFVLRSRIARRRKACGKARRYRFRSARSTWRNWMIGNSRRRLLPREYIAQESLVVRSSNPSYASFLL